jgi:phosphatidylethanolamine/phosphatidyl-N-methylethanolamine N-methyltransferase
MTPTPAIFLRQFLRSPKTVGAVAPSSRALAHAMLAPIDFGAARVIVEFGPGTGAFTAGIARRMATHCRYLGIELNPRFVHELRRRFPGLDFVQGNVADFAGILADHRISGVDAVICGLPWATLPISLQETVFAAMRAALAPGGLFITFGYLQGLLMPGARALRRRLRREFADVRQTSPVWGNVPPAFAYICRARR